MVAASWLELNEGSAVAAVAAVAEVAGAASSGAASVNHVTDEAILVAASFSAVFWSIASALALCE